METKTCNDCGKTLPVSEFPIRSSDGKPHLRCQTCLREYHRRNYHLRQERKKEQARLAQERSLLLTTSIMEAVDAAVAHSMENARTNASQRAKKLLEKRPESSVF